MSSSPIELTINENWSTIWDRVAATVPDRPAVISGDQVITYAQLEDRAARLAMTLAANGIGSGDRVGLFMYNRREYLETIYAAFKLGAIPVNMNFRYRAEELTELLRISGADALLYPVSLGRVVSAAMTAIGSPPLLLEVVDDLSTGVAGAMTYDIALTAEPLRTPQALSGDDRIFVFTGGTTGLPRAVVWLHAQLFDAQLVSLYGPARRRWPTSLTEIVGRAADVDVAPPITLPITPLMHAMAMFNTMNTLVLGGTVVFLDSPSFDPERTLRTIAQRRVSRVIIAGNAVAVPLIELLESPARARDPIDVSSVTSIMSSGMLWSDETKRHLLQHFTAQLFDIVGSSEGGPYAYSTVSSLQDLPSRLQLADGAVVLDETGAELDPESGQVGLLAYRGAMPLGYFNDPVKTAQVYQTRGVHRYVAPGDWVRLLGGGRLEFLGRGSAVVNTGGEKVYPAEVEDVLLAMDDVADCAVFGVDDDRWGQVVAAVVEPRPGAQLSPAAVTERLTTTLAGYKKPRRVVMVESMGRSPSGKLDLLALRDLVAPTSPTTPSPGQGSS